MAFQSCRILYLLSFFQPKESNRKTIRIITSNCQRGPIIIIVHVVVVSLLSNVGKLFPVFFYRDRKLSVRLALSIGMFTRGEVGAGVIFIALGYNLGGPALVISVLTIVLNLILTGIFVLWVKKLALMSYQE